MPITVAMALVVQNQLAKIKLIAQVLIACNSNTPGTWTQGTAGEWKNGVCLSNCTRETDCADEKSQLQWHWLFRTSLRKSS